jgi:predicted phosphate transport protein (TIGR00153 family)
MLFPKTENFSDLYEELADNIERSGLLFLEMLRHYDRADEYIARLSAVENEADSVTHKIYRMLHKTFITPLDREDLYALVNKMDNIVDMIDTCAERMGLYKVGSPHVLLEDLVRIMNEAVVLVKRLIYDMRRRKENHDVLLESCHRIDELESEGDHILRGTMQRLFEQKIDAIELIKWKDIFERVEAVIDTCRDVSSVVEGMILKYG